MTVARSASHLASFASSSSSASCIACSATAASGCDGNACCRVGSVEAVSCSGAGRAHVRRGRRDGLEHGRESEAEGGQGNRAEHHIDHPCCRLPPPDETHGARVAPALGILQGSVAVVVEQLGVGPGVQQGLHALLVPLVSSHHQGGVAALVDATAALHVRVGRVLQEEEHDGCVAVARSFHERGVAEAVRQVDLRASLQQLPHHLQAAVGYGSVQQGRGWLYGLTAHTWSRVESSTERVDRPAVGQPPDHLLHLA
eukprot:scaffold31098_cov75-Phaeocystis_antarctica.AAC.1